VSREIMTPDIPTHVSPAELVPLVQKAVGTWEPGSRRWLVERRRIGPLIRNLHRATDPLFRRAGIDLDGRDA
jgi:hypothetical protein